MTKQTTVLETCYSEDINILEVGVDEAGRGPLFGRVYSAAAILPKDDSFNHGLMKDSKRFTSKKKINEVYEYIKENAIAWDVAYEDEKTVDKINILNATHQSMHNAIKGVMNKQSKFNLLIDGNNFKPFMKMTGGMLVQVPHICIEGGDNKYSAIAAASIIAKVTRDKYIEDLCKENSTLQEYYGLENNKGYGTKRHIDGIREHGISTWHRKSYGICKEYC